MIVMSSLRVDGYNYSRVKSASFFVSFLQLWLYIGRRFGTSKIHLIPPAGGLDCRPLLGGGSVAVDLLFIVTPIVWVCNCSIFCCTLPLSILILRSSCSGRESWLLCLVCLLGVSWRLCGSSLRYHGFFCGLWLWYFLIIHTYYFS